MLVKISDKTIIVASKVKRIDLCTGVGIKDSVMLTLGKGETVFVSPMDFGVTGPVLLEMVADAIKRALDGQPVATTIRPL